MPAEGSGDEKATVVDSGAQQRVAREKVYSQIMNNMELVDVPSIDRIRLERSKEFQSLVRRYMTQIRYGCPEKNCTTPTCFSCHKRKKNVPIQRPTTITSRAFAFLLASDDDPYSGLCPHLPSTMLESMYSLPSEEVDADVQWKENNSSPLFDNYIEPDLGARPSVERPVPAEPAYTSKSLPNSTPRPTRQQKDRLSLSQNLYDTRAMKDFEWTDVHSPANILRASLEQRDLSNAHPVGEILVHRLNGYHPKPAVESLNSGGTHFEQNGTASEGKLATNESSNCISHMQNPSGSIERIGKDSQIPNSPSSTRRPVISILSDETMWDLRGLMWWAIMHSKGMDAANLYHSGSIYYTLAKAHQDLTDAFPLERPECTLQNKQELMHYVTLSISYHLSDAKRLLKSFTVMNPRNHRHMKSNNSIPSSLQRFLDGTSQPLLPEASETWISVGCLSCWTPLVGPLIFNSLWLGLEALFIPPPDINLPKSPRLRPQRSGKSPEPAYVADVDAAHMINVAIFALVGSIEGTFSAQTLLDIRNLRAFGRVVANSRQSGAPDDWQNPWLQMADCFEYEPAVRLACRLVRVIAARRSFWLISQTLRGPSSGPRKERFPLMDLVIAKLASYQGELAPHFTAPLADLFIDWLRVVMVKNWNGKAEVKRWEPFGAAMEVMSDLYPRRRSSGLNLLNLHQQVFVTPFLSNHLTEELLLSPDLPYRESGKNTLNVFHFPFLFAPDTHVKYFRILNFTKMAEAYQSASYHRGIINLIKDTIDPTRIHDDDSPFGDKSWNRLAFVQQRLKPALTQYLVLDVKRESLLEDTFDQLWGREKREILRPLKVRMGMDTGGEEGVDQGGVSQEFFRIVFEKAFDPDAGLFIIDEQTRLSWFQPLSLEPSQTYELLGLLVSLAIYNGITLPISFPLQLYEKLLTKPGEAPRTVIGDGWPVLADGLYKLLQWEDGDVSNVFVREYAFDFKANGQRHLVDMLKIRRDEPWPLSSNNDAGPSQSSNELQLVTNANREQYVQDYIHWLVHKSIAPQYSAFARGFYQCLDMQTLSLLTPEILQKVAEGYSDIDLKGLKGCTRYEDGYTKDHNFIKWFWEIVETYDINKKRLLLEFVTACDRVPVQGWGSFVFCVVRNGGDSDLLPTAMTCYGKLLLPEYESKEKLRGKLYVALENGKGFGTA